MKRLTQEEFMERFYIKNETAENIEILGEYVNNKTKIKCKCKIDGYEWETMPKNLLNNRGCPKCSRNAKKTTEEFKREMKEINKNIEILGEYINDKTKIKVRCKIDRHEWEVMPSNLLRGKGCPKCASNMKKSTHEEFINKLKEINSDIEVLGEYVSSKSKIKVRCKIDGYEWETKPNSLLSGYGCPKCSGNAKLTHEEFVDRIRDINSDIKIIGEYINVHTKIKCRCKIDRYEWETRPDNLLNGKGCPKCAGMYKTTEEFINELKEVNDNIEILGEYKSSNKKIKVRCKLDGYEWSATPNNLLRGYGCPKCNESKGEKRVAKYLDSRNIDYERQYKFDECRSKDKLPFDFYIPSLNIAIEYDGEDHYMIIFRSKNDTYNKALNRFIGTKVRDTIKTIYCKENNIKLIRIPYWDFDNIEKILEKELERTKF